MSEKLIPRQKVKSERHALRLRGVKVVKKKNLVTTFLFFAIVNSQRARKIRNDKPLADG